MRKTLQAAAVILWSAVFAAPRPAPAQDASTQALLDAVKADPNNAAAHYNLGGVYLNEGKYDLAAAEFRKCLQTDSGDKRAREYLEMSEGFSAYTLRNDYAQAAAHFKATLELNPQNPNANYFLGKSYLQLKKTGEAEAVFKNYAAALEDSESQINANQGLAKIYIESERYPEAVEALRKVEAAKPKDKDINLTVYKSLGFSFFQMKDYEGAVSAWEKALAFKEDPKVFYFLGLSYYKKGQFQKSIRNYKKSAELNPDDWETFYNLAVSYYDNGLYDEAADSFGRAFKLKKDSDAALGQAQSIDKAFESHMEKGNNFILNNEYSAAVTEWQKALEYKPGQKQAQEFIAEAQGKQAEEVEKTLGEGRSYLGKGDSLRALAAFNRVLEMDSDNAKARAAVKKINLNSKEAVKARLAHGDEFLNGQNYTGALKKYEEAARVDPKNKNVKAKIVQVKKRQAEEFERALALGNSRAKEERYNEAVKYYESAKMISPSGAEAANVGDLLFKANKAKREKIKSLMDEKKYQAVLVLDPDNTTANEAVRKQTGQLPAQKAEAENIKKLYYDGVNYYINGKIKEAIKVWDDVLAVDPENVNARKNIVKAKAKLDSLEKLSRN
jgi:tetratricopeptide (TPR) repeat protein